MKKLFSTILLALLTGFISNIYSENSEYGLYIKAFPSGDQEKTTLVLENNQPLKLHKEMTMSFNVYVRKENVFGVVFRMITNKKDNIDLTFTVGENDKRYPMLVLNESVHLIPQEIICDQWIPVSITLSSEKDEISILFGTTRLTQTFPISKSNNVETAFGLCPFEGYTLYDVASVNIRDIKIWNKKNEIRNWKLDIHNEKGQSPDSIAQMPAITVNPRWLSDIHATWTKVYSKKVKEETLFAFNSRSNCFYIVSPDSKEIKIIYPETEKEEVIEVKSGIIASNATNQIFYDRNKNLLVTYNLDENIVSHFSFETLSWNSQDRPTKEHAYWNNSACFADSVFISFGGYGFYKYNNELLRLDSDGKVIKKSNLPDISPRYSASTVIVNNTLYILGGRGNKSGRQELSPRNFYDFYSVNLLTEQVNKMWEIDNMDSEFLPGENMIFDAEKNCFYVFTTKEGGKLMRVKLDKPGFERISFSLSEEFTSHYLYTNLYFSPEHKKLYVLINKINTDKTAEVSIYSLCYPPILINTIPIKEQVEENNLFLFRLIGLILAGLILAGIGWYIYKKKSSGKYPDMPVIPEEKTEVETLSIPESINGMPKPKETIDEKNYYDFSKQSICFLGGFHVTDKSGNDITGQFTPMLKFLLVLLILSTEKDPKGISGKKLIQILWFDKSEDSAKNNRNVYLSKLRATLENIGNIEIVNQNGFWSILLHTDVSCDYIEAMKLFAAIKDTSTPNQTEVNRLLELLLRGVLLPNTEADWVDGYKSDFSNLTIDNLTQLLHSNLYKLSDNLKLKISDTLFLHDYINEEALYLKCSILFNSGKKGIAKAVYDNFCKEYRNLLGTDYRYSLTDVINRKNIEN